MMKMKIVTIIRNVGSYLHRNTMSPSKKMIKFKFVCKFVLSNNSNC